MVHCAFIDFYLRRCFTVYYLCTACDRSPLSAIIFTTFIVNLRHLLLSLTLAPHFTRYSVKQNIGFGLLLTDESFGVAMNKLAQQGKLNNRWMHGLNITAYLCWIAACILGGILDTGFQILKRLVLILLYQRCLPHC